MTLPAPVLPLCHLHVIYSNKPGQKLDKDNFAVLHLVLKCPLSTTPPRCFSHDGHTFLMLALFSLWTQWIGKTVWLKMCPTVLPPRQMVDGSDTFTVPTGGDVSWGFFPKQHRDASGHTHPHGNASCGCLRAAFVAAHLMTANGGQRGDCLASVTAAKSSALIRAQSLGQSGQTGCLLHPPGPFNYLPDGGLIQVGISHPIDNGASVSCRFSTHYQVLILSSVSCCPICPSPAASF